MYVYLVRHAIAFDHDAEAWPDDRERPLTQQGQKKFRRAARGLAGLVPRVDVVLSSPLTRAWQTAEILRQRAGWPEPLRFDPLEPGRQPGDAVEALQPHASAQTVVLVGHEPSLHELASYLLSGDPSMLRLTMKKGGVACLSTPNGIQPGAASLEWVLQPRVLRSLQA